MTSPAEDNFVDEPRVMQVQVLNKNKFPIEDRFDDCLFTFLPNIPKTIPVDAANHIFGWFPPFEDEDGRVHKVDPAVMRLHVMRRFGWNTPEFLGGKGDIYYGNLVIQPIVYKMVAVQQEEEPEPFDPEIGPIGENNGRKRTNRLMAAAAERAAAVQP